MATSLPTAPTAQPFNRRQIFSDALVTEFPVRLSRRHLQPNRSGAYGQVHATLRVLACLHPNHRKATTYVAKLAEFETPLARARHNICRFRDSLFLDGTTGTSPNLPVPFGYART